ncbi:MAG: hypothetical protein AAB701_02230 [Patescibacteria group bacterium]
MKRTWIAAAAFTAFAVSVGLFGYFTGQVNTEAAQSVNCPQFIAAAEQSKGVASRGLNLLVKDYEDHTSGISIPNPTDIPVDLPTGYTSINFIAPGSQKAFEQFSIGVTSSFDNFRNAAIEVAKGDCGIAAYTPLQSEFTRLTSQYNSVATGYNNNLSQSLGFDPKGAHITAYPSVSLPSYSTLAPAGSTAPPATTPPQTNTPGINLPTATGPGSTTTTGSSPTATSTTLPGTTTTGGTTTSGTASTAKGRGYLTCDEIYKTYESIPNNIGPIVALGLCFMSSLLQTLVGLLQPLTDAMSYIYTNS